MKHAAYRVGVISVENGRGSFSEQKQIWFQTIFPRCADLRPCLLLLLMQAMTERQRHLTYIDGDHQEFISRH